MGYLILRSILVLIMFLSVTVGTVMFLEDWETQVQMHTAYAVGSFALFVAFPFFSLAFAYSFVMQGME